MRKEDYIKYSFTKNFKSSMGRTEMLFRIHKGFESKEDLEQLLISKGYDLDYVVVVCFLDMYYGVIFEDYDRNYIIGKLKTYYVSDKFIHQGCNTKTFKPKFYPNFIKEQVYTHQTLAYDLKDKDPNLDVLVRGKSIVQYEYANTYVVILALTFIDYYFSINEMYILNNYYFSQDYSDSFTKNIVGINPFKGKVMLSSGAIRSHQFYKGFVPYYMRNKHWFALDKVNHVSISYGDVHSYATLDELDSSYSVFSKSSKPKNKSISTDTNIGKVIYLTNFRK